MKTMPDIFWIGGKPAPGLAIVSRPPGGELLENELRRIHAAGIDTIASLLQPDEADYLGLEDEEAAARRAGLNFLSFPITDGQVPWDVYPFRQFIRGMATRLGAGEHIGIHCRGCIGRSTITAACALIHLGWKARAAVQAIAQARGVPVPDNPFQEDWIRRYKAVP